MDLLAQSRSLAAGLAQWGVDGAVQGVVVLVSLRTALGSAPPRRHLVPGGVLADGTVVDVTMG